MWCQANPGDGSVLGGQTSWFSCPVKQNHMMCSNARPSLWLLRPDSSSGVSLVEGRGRDGSEGAPLFHCAYHVVLVTLQDVSCFLSIIPSVLTPPVRFPLPLPSHSSPSSFEALFIFKTTTRFFSCRFPPWSSLSIRCVGWDARPSKRDTWRRQCDGERGGGCAGRKGDAGWIQRQTEARKEKCGDGKQDRCEERQECRRGRTISADKWLRIDTTQTSFIPFKGISGVNIIHKWQERHRGGMEAEARKMQGSSWRSGSSRTGFDFENFFMGGWI